MMNKTEARQLKTEKSTTSKIWQDRHTLCENILNELLATEFKEIEGKTYLNITKKLPSVPLAGTCWGSFLKVKVNIIWISPCAWEEFKNFSTVIRSVLRHELLHVLLGKGNDDPEFINEAIKRNILLKYGNYEGNLIRVLTCKELMNFYRRNQSLAC